MTFNYKAISPSDKELISSFTLHSDRQNCDLSFSNLCSWRFLYHTEFAIAGDTLILKFRTEDSINYMMPVGGNGIRAAVAGIIEECREGGYPFLMRGICKAHLPLLETWMPDTFEFSTERNYYDYIYLRKDLAELKGKRFQAKRNHVNKLIKTHTDWEYLPLTSAHIPECVDMARKWCIANHCDEEHGLGDEFRAVSYALHHFHALGLMGGVLRVAGKTVAFTFGMPINKDTFGIHAEKADASVEGAYALINQEFARRIPEPFTYLNREEDLGLEGLRKAKLSYHPTLILEKYTATLK